TRHPLPRRRDRRLAAPTASVSGLCRRGVRRRSTTACGSDRGGRLCGLCAPTFLVGHVGGPCPSSGWRPAPVGVGDRTPCGLSLVGLPIPALRTGRARFRASGSPRSAHGENLFEPGVLVGVVYVDQTESGSGRVDLVGVPGV